ncbi:oligoendopeptidase F [Aerococcus kribbianus]|uniref:Oligopeptidase F n=1 Tax=Aerococcus kribbianus TaxID=2999064 RepID=A0A9X3FNV4_9LACT|nr:MULTISPECIES: oligoendopeptidase F [unclassified Aerococcus]MCZ0717744.1 oligoendopeptidase F [Aerococcus sp. YH-aer221]MCZ0726032.1 oligoendopeptidase F [Aerococcus sp. YH-aer222]
MGNIIEAQAREANDPKYQWDLTTIYPDDEAFEADLADFMESLDQVEEYRGSLDQGKAQVIAALEGILAISRKLEKLYVYSHLKSDQDTSNNHYLSLQSQMQAIAAQVGQKMAWFEPELLALDDSLLGELTQHDDYGHFFQSLVDSKDHVLSPDQEALLAGGSQVFANASNTFAVLNNSDMTFGKVDGEDDNEISLSHGTYGVLLESSDRDLRERTFKQYYASYQELKNTFAQLMSGNIKHHNFIASTRHYDSARQAALDQNHIPESVYDTLVSTVNDNLSLLHDYVALRKELLGVDSLEFYDLYTPLTKNDPITFTYEEAKEIVFKALAPLGQQYLEDLEQAFDQGWIDVYENIGKRSGAYSSGAYDTNPYVLLNWQDSLNDLYTLVHELGHSMHSYYTRQNQDYVYGDYSIFVAEIASTTNENLLTAYLLEELADDQEQIYLLTQYLDGFKGTIFRQTQFAEFEQFMHESDANGQALSADFLSENYYELTHKYYGEALGDDPTIAYEWSRIPHFYMNYYVYQYATGFAAANSLAKRLLSGDPQAREDYLNYLKAGSSDYPIEVMKRAGIDMTNANYIEDAMEQFQERLDELKQLVND